MISWNNNKKIKRRERVSNAILLLAAFLVFAVLFGGLCVWTAVKIDEERRSVVSSEIETPSSDTVKFAENDIRDLLIITVDDEDAQGFVVLRADPDKTKIWALAFPRDTVVDVKTSEIKLCDLYKQQGITAVKASMENLSGLTFDNYAVFSYANLEKLLDHFEAGLVLNVPEKLDYTNKNVILRMDSGVKTLRASQVIGLLQYPSWQGGRKQQADMQAQVASAMVNQFMTETRASKADTDFGVMVNLSKTDMLISHYTDAKPGLMYLQSKNQGEICTAFTLDGEYEGSGDAIRYYAADSIKKTLSSAFGQTS